MTTDTTAIVAKPADANMVAGPLSLGLVIAGPAAFGIGCLLWKPDEIIDHWEVLLIFAAIFVPVFVLVRTVLSRLAFWRIENGEVYRGKKLLFRLDEIQAVQIGLPDNWLTTLSRLPIKTAGSAGLKIAAISRQNLVVLKLTEGRWYMWHGFLYQGFEAFRDALIAAAAHKSIDEVPESILPKLQLRYANRILKE